ncbi:TetR/AcrR family transcriptional regulator [Neptuniibacter pectenicola]|uniref:TetR/AcrR family transcriptional regulator n=1 Tax=Neptuniibacter pectenicola TaxID=1806669 RepID=UPI00082ED47E|nr:TetR/AcrR family transcriptional regulator [Neptuniibacter pectenicola]
MARTRDIKNYDDAKTRLLDTGMSLIRSESFSGIGINDVLKKSGVPRGSFYHYFKSKEAFGLEVAQYYHGLQIDGANQVLNNENLLPIDRLEAFFRGASEEFKTRNYADGCLMCNLSTELADTNNEFQKILKKHWAELSSEVAECLALIQLSDIGLSHLTNMEAADWLMNAWSGALVRMKAERSEAPLQLFEKTIFNIKKGTRT